MLESGVVSLPQKIKLAYGQYVAKPPTGVGGRVAGAVLRLLAMPYSLCIGIRNGLYNVGILQPYEVDRCVVSVGNLSTGGTGKTPLVEWICRFYREEYLEPVILSRGYGRGHRKENDESALLAQALPDVRHYQSKNRVSAATRAVREGPTDVFVMDDGFQHRRMARSLDIVVVDAMSPPSEDRVIPAGRLRESPSSLRRAAAIVLTRANLVEKQDLETLCEDIQRVAPGAVIAVTRYVPRFLLRVPCGEQSVLDLARRTETGAFCGIGSPENFLETLKSVGIEPVTWQVFPDHHWYSDDELFSLADSDVKLLLTTPKDAVRIGDRWNGRLPLYAVSADLQFLSGQEELKRLLSEAVSKDGTKTTRKTQE